MAQIGGCWSASSWVVVNGWAANTWSAAGAAVTKVIQLLTLQRIGD